MSRPTTRTPVAIFNSHAEFVDALRAALDREGSPTTPALLAEIQDGTLLRQFQLAVHELMYLSEELRELISRRASEDELREAARRA